MEDLQVQITQQAGMISCNFDEMKAYLQDFLKEYESANFTDEGIKTAKVITADLRKQQTAFKDRIKEVKKAYMAPFEDFKAKADELVALYDKPIQLIDGQVKDYETRRKAAKAQYINEIYSELFGDLAELVPLGQIYNSRWENKTYSYDDIKKDITQLAEKVATELDILDDGSQTAERCKKLYLSCLDLPNVLKKKKEWEEILKEQEEQKRAADVEQIRQQEREKLLAEQKALAEITAAREEALAAYIPENTGEEETAYLYSINLTPAEKEALEMYMDSVGIEYSEV